MNPVKAAFCRTFQQGFRIMYPFFPYREPEELDSDAEIPEKLVSLGLRSALLVTNTSLRSLGVTSSLEETMKRAGVACTVYDKTPQNPSVDHVEEAFSLYRKDGCGAVIGFGGGSCIDCAKTVAARAAYPSRSVRQLAGNLKFWGSLPPVFAVPTTAGTGSEATLAAVLVDGETKRKFTINAFPLIPRYAVLDPMNTVGLPPFFTATTGIDALTHAVEAYIGQSTTRETRAWSLRATRLIFRYLPRAYRDGSDLEARQAMLRASYLAGLSFTRSYVGYCHAVAHSLGGLYDTPHGLANSVLLPHVLRAYGASIHKPLRELAGAAGLAVRETPEAVAAESFIRGIEQMNRELGIPDRLPGICPEDIEVLSRNADREGNPLYPVPRLMDRRELKQFYTAVSQSVSCPSHKHSGRQGLER